jgi:hypothetical protein
MGTIELNVFMGVSSRAYVALESSEAVGVPCRRRGITEAVEVRSFGGQSRLQLRWVSSNNCLERSRGRVFGEPRRGSMIEINQLRFSSAQPASLKRDR